MKKLRLNVEKLEVESFGAATAPVERGTVDAQDLPCSHPQVCPASKNWWCTGVCTCTQYPEYCIP